VKRGVGGLCFEGVNIERSSTFWKKKVHPGDLAGGFSDLEMTWLLYCAGAATDENCHTVIDLRCAASPACVIPTRDE